jgi:peptide chain release factor 1
MLPAQRLDALIARHAELEAELSKGAGGDSFVKLSREHAELSPVIDDVKALKRAQDDLAGVEQMLAGNDAEMARMAGEEKRELEATIEALTQKLRLALIPKDEADARDAVLEVHRRG